MLGYFDGGQGGCWGQMDWDLIDWKRATRRVEETDIWGGAGALVQY